MISMATNSNSYPSVEEAVLKMANLIFIFFQAYPHPKFCGKWGHWLCSASHQFYLSVSQIKHHHSTQLSVVFVSLSGHLEPEDSLHSLWGNVTAPLSGWQWEGPLDFPNKLFSLERLGAILSLVYELTFLTVHSTPGTGFALRMINSACLPLDLSVTRLNSFQELPPALLVRWGFKSLSQKWDCDSAPCLGVGKLGFWVEKLLT